SRGFRFGERVVTPAEYAERTLGRLLALAQQGSGALCAALPREFLFFRNAGVGAGKFTAYYNPVYRGSRRRHGPYQHPLYRKPPGALSRKTTAEILAGALAGRDLELIYLSDATETMNCHVEGSATILLDDGTETNVTNEGTNGLPFVNVSRLLMADG